MTAKQCIAHIHKMVTYVHSNTEQGRREDTWPSRSEATYPDMELPTELLTVQTLYITYNLSTGIYLYKVWLF